MTTKITNILVISVILLGLFVFAGDRWGILPGDLSVYINEQKLHDAHLDIDKSQVLIDQETIFSALGIEGLWDPSTKTLTGQKKEVSFSLTMKSRQALLNGKEVQLRVVPKIKKDQRLLPLNFLAEAVGASVRWDKKTDTAYVTLDNDCYRLREEDGISYPAKVVGKDFVVCDKGNPTTPFLTGVNIGAGKPGHFPGELAITKEEYLRWFSYISELNADLIRVYTLMRPVFYNALHEFNQTADTPLYLIHGVWLRGDDILDINDAFGQEAKIKKDFIQDTKGLIDIIHGDKILPFKKGLAGGVYTKDVSKYVLAFVLGIEWDPYFVDNTNYENPDKTSYEGDYLYTKEAPPFETFLCQVGDAAVAYETEKYQMQRPISFSNWPTTDMLSHPNEPYVIEDMVTVNTEHIKVKKEAYKAGLFAAYHIYPHYPDFLHYQKDYASYIDEDGQINSYRAYLSDLIDQHTVPVMVAEFGVASSRGKAHNEPHSGKNQGQHREEEQGRINTGLLEDIYQEGYFSALLFTWQDEWFKKSWNTWDLDDPQRRPLWSNVQTNEQGFGLLAFDPGPLESVAYVDGQIEEWQKLEPLVQSPSTSPSTSLHVKADERYLYLMAQIKDYDPQKDTVFVPIDSLDGQGNRRDEESGLSFSRAADFLISVQGKRQARIQVDSYYDSFHYINAKKDGLLPLRDHHEQKNSGHFVPMLLGLSRSTYLPLDQVTLPFTAYETGKLTYGIAHPNHVDYNSLADYYIAGDQLEIRIPWQLLNVMDPSQRTIMDDFHQEGQITGTTIEEIHLELIVDKGSRQIRTGFSPYSWPTWDLPSYHERLKKSYYLVQKAFAKLEDSQVRP